MHSRTYEYKAITYVIMLCVLAPALARACARTGFLNDFLTTMPKP